MNAFDRTTNVFLNATVSISLNTRKINTFMHFFFACSVNLESLTCQIDIVLLPRHQTQHLLQIIKCVGKLHVLRRDLLCRIYFNLFLFHGSGIMFKLDKPHTHNFFFSVIATLAPNMAPSFPRGPPPSPGTTISRPPRLQRARS